MPDPSSTSDSADRAALLDLLAAERQRADALEALQATLADISSELELPRVLRAVVERAVTLLKGTGGELSIYDETRHTLRVMVSHNLGEDYTGLDMTEGEGAMGAVIQTRAPLIINDYATWEGRSTQYRDGRWHAAMAVPLLAGGRLLGALGVVEANPNHKFSPADLKWFALFGQQAAVAIANARLYSEAQRRTQELSRLYAATHDLTASLEPSVVLEKLARHIAEALDVTSAYILEVNLENRLLKVLAEYWTDNAAAHEKKSDIGQTYPLEDYPLLEQAITQHTIIGFHIDDPQISEVERTEFGQYGVQSAMFVPMVIHGQVLGEVEVWETRRKRVFTPEETDLARTLAQHAASALEVARLFQAEQSGRESVAAILDISLVVGSSLDLMHVLRHIARRTAQACRTRRCSIYLMDEFGEYLQPVMAQFADGRDDPAQWERFKTLTADRLDTVPLFRDVMRKFQALTLKDPSQTDLMPLAWTEPFGVQKLFAVPLMAQERAIGVMALDDDDPAHEFTSRQVDLAYMIGWQVASAIVNARLYTEAETRADELAMLVRVGEVLTLAQTPDQTLHLVLSEALRLVSQHKGSVVLYEPEEGHLHIVAQVGLTKDEVRVFNDQDWRAENGLFAQAMRRIEMMEIKDQTDPRLSSADPDLFKPPCTIVPLPTITGAIGGIVLAGLPRSERSRSLLHALADLAAASIEKARLLEETRRRAEQLRALHLGSRALTSHLSLDEVLRTLAETVQNMAHARYAVLLVLDAKGSVNKLHTVGFTDEENTHINALPWGEGALRQALQQGEVIRVDDLTQDPRLATFAPHLLSEQAFMGVPITAREKIMGGLYLIGKTDDQPFRQEDESLVTGLAGDAAIAIENAHLFGEVQRLATTDGLTGVFNRRHFFELAEREFERSHRYQRPLSAIMLDVDHFKKVNDTYGHSVGDQVLRVVAQRCREHMRKIDLLGRYGGEEFAILLQETDQKTAEVIAERLRQYLADNPVDSDSGPLKITASLGLATLWAECPNLAALLDRADAGLYNAKRTGRNRVCVGEAGEGKP